MPSMTNPADETAAFTPFPGAMENKSAESLADETKTAEQTAGDDTKEPAVAATETDPTVTAPTEDHWELVKVELIHHLTVDGIAQVPGAVLEVTPDTANGLISSTYAKLVV